VRGRWAIEDEELEPARWADVRVRWRGDRACVSVTGERREERPLSKAVSVRRRHSSEQRNMHCARRPLLQGDHNLVGATVGPVAVCDSVGRLLEAAGKIRWYIYFHAVLLWVYIVLWVTACNKDTPILKKKDGRKYKERSKH